MSEIEPEKASGVSIEGDLIVFADARDKGVKVFLFIAEYERVVDVYEDVGGLGRSDAIEEEAVESRLKVSFGKEGSRAAL